MEDFNSSVEDGLKLSKRIYYGKDRSVAAPPRPPPLMSKSPHSYLPSSPMVYAVVSDPGIVDNPDIPSYQPHVYGRFTPPALIPLQMNSVSMEVDCILDSVFVRVSGQWRVHCVMGSKACFVRIAVPMGEQGSILGVEVDIPRKAYHTQLVDFEEKRDEGKTVLGADDGTFLKPDIFLLTIPQVDGGTNLSIKISWSQKMLYHGNEFSLHIPFSFPEYVTPASKKIPKREKILLNFHTGADSEVHCRNTSHPLKEQRCHVENHSFLYESDVLTWSSTDFSFSYSMHVRHICGSVFLQSPSEDDGDNREMFCIHVLPGNHKDKKVFARRIVYVVDISGSMRGKPLEATKNALSTSLYELTLEDSFNIIAFNGHTSQFSSSPNLANKDTVDEAIQWMENNFIVGDGTNISLALNQAMDMLSDTPNSLSMIFLITDGTADDERQICNTTKNRLSSQKPICPRIHTFGIGFYCNHYFLRMLAMIGRGCYDSAYDKDSIEFRLHKLFNRASSAVLANISFDTLNELDNVEVHTISVPDLSLEGPLTITGKYTGNFPEVLKTTGILADMTNYEMDLKVQKEAKIPLERMVAMQQITMYTAQAWFSQEKQLQSKVAELSIRNGILSEYTSMGLFMTETLNKEADIGLKKKKTTKAGAKKAGDRTGDPKPQKIKILTNTSIGFGNLKATIENIPPRFEEPKPPEAAEIIVKAVSDCCTRICGYCCGMCCIHACSKVSNQCATAFTQLCTALACFGCLNCCTEVCCAGQD